MLEILKWVDFFSVRQVKKNFKQRSDYYSDLARRQNESVNNNFMRDGDPRMPKLNESSTRVTFGGGAKPS